MVVAGVENGEMEKQRERVMAERNSLRAEQVKPEHSGRLERGGRGFWKEKV